MTNLNNTRDRAMEAIIAAVHSIVEHPGKPANIVLSRKAVDAIAQHAIATANQLHQDGLDVYVHDNPDPPATSTPATPSENPQPKKDNPEQLTIDAVDRPDT